MKETEVESDRYYLIGKERRWKKSNAATIRIQDGKLIPNSVRPALPEVEVDHIESDHNVHD